MNHTRSIKRFCWRTCIVALVALVCLRTDVKAQPIQPLFNPIYVIDSQLREMFSPLCRPTPSCDFLYEMASHHLDSITFTDNNPDTINRDHWFMIYDELTRMAYDPSGMSSQWDVYTNGAVYAADTVQMNILAYDYFRFNDSALTTDYAFEFDTITNEITEKFPCELFPYVTHRVFASAPIGYNMKRQNIYFRIDPASFFMTNSMI